MERPSIFEAVGGEPALLALAAAHHRRCVEDDVLNHPFAASRPEHVQRLAWYWGEVLGGPARFSERCGGQPAMMRLHSGNGMDDDLGDRFFACFDRALDDADLPDDPELRGALRAYVAWAAAEVMAADRADPDASAGAAMPRWTWDGLARP